MEVPPPSLPPPRRRVECVCNSGNSLPVRVRVSPPRSHSSLGSARVCKRPKFSRVNPRKLPKFLEAGLQPRGSIRQRMIELESTHVAAVSITERILCPTSQQASKRARITPLQSNLPHLFPREEQQAPRRPSGEQSSKTVGSTWACSVRGRR